ncbi:hypothetical protein BU25DRAFT_405180 [Macroventuria anomochaeta]|uniref:Uncharacterized protein n=1 Tax=Macroventuria anomochaeta TaxID=301207 RepID=A0ACB6SGV5_9PLEO|nr:uncharacterized protein BU25DRAFT_405180 [Macroventuria anomochaeta]KAF2633259.1 hypothetical protein BU25DRAFT_405180 [Macroventuria anomochaeta]
MSAEPLPPDVQAARKARINSDIIKLCSKPIPLYSHPTAHGIGLYTHVAGTKTVARNPHSAFADKRDGEVALLPLGGPKKIVPSKLHEPPNKELAAIYKELQDAVKAEEKIWSDMRVAADERGEAPNDAYRMSLDTLKKKYGDVNAPPPESAMSQRDSKQQDKRRHSEVTGIPSGEAPKKKRVGFASQSELQRQSTDASMRERNSDAERRGSGSRAGNEYDVYRDPRRQRR